MENAQPAPRLKRLLAPLGALGVLLLNWAAKLKGLLLLLPKLKLLTTAGSMGLSVVAYALLWGPAFGVGFVALLFAHEMGHFVQMRREGVRPNWMVFIPFMGAAVGARSLGGSALAEARVGLAGPVLGTLACVGVATVGLATGEHFWLALAFTGFLLNLFNLLPVVPLDGGRAMAAISPRVWIVGFAGLLVAAILFPNPIIFIIVLFAGLEAWRRFKLRKSPEHQAYHDVSRGTRIAVGAVYIGLALLLVVGMHYTHFHRTLN
jgi:Zn-dependent protease